MSIGDVYSNDASETGQNVTVQDFLHHVDVGTFILSILFYPFSLADNVEMHRIS